eukprot:TRINITY_DN5329_c0_g1_i2.p1 TRINITY_DN5329_c0_g1~~TRINITY_DN5329_c0_g1_i2.p1  ORF type:complete len:446 (-),score=127.15 TRINITY_DN5329_c0_g1_i2:577-1914(-)
MQNVLKVYLHAVGSESSSKLIGDDEGETNNGDKEVTSEFVTGLVDLITSRLPLFTQSTHLEVQERACFVLEMVRTFSEFREQGVDVSQELRSLFEEALNPVAPKVQKKVPIPEGLDLDQSINDPKADVSSDEDDVLKEKKKRRKQKPTQEESSSDESGFLPATRKDKEQEDAEELARQKEERRQRLASNAANPYMLGARSQRQGKALQEEPNIPIEQLPTSTLSPSGLIVGIGMPKTSSERDSKGRRKRGEKKKEYTVDTTVEMPEGVEEEQLQKDTEEIKDALSQIDITTPLESYETLPVQRHRIVDTQKPKVEEKSAEKKDHKDRKSRHGEEGRRHRSDKDKPERKSKSDKSDKKVKEGSLIDFDLGVESSASATVTSPATVSSPGVETKESYLELESPIDSRVEKKKERHHSGHRDRDSKDSKDRHSRRDKQWYQRRVRGYY